MKQSISILLLTLLISSCAPKTFYQLVELSSNNIKEGESENEDIKINIDFWENGGTTQFSIFNKSLKTIYIKYDECQVIKNGMAYDLYDNSEYSSNRGIITSKTNARKQQKGASISKSNIYGSSSFNTVLGAAASIYSASISASASNFNSVTTTMSNTKSVSSTDMKTFVLQPQSYRIIDGVYLQSSRFYDCNVLASVSNKQSNIENGMSFPKEASPFNLRIIITYSYDDSFTDKKTYELDAYVSRFSNWNMSEFVKQEKYKKCEDDIYFKYRDVTDTYSPMRYYIRYDLEY